MLGNCIHENQRPKKVSLSSPDVVKYNLWRGDFCRSKINETLREMKYGLLLISFGIIAAK